MSKPIQLLKTFTDKELDSFQKLLNSNYLTSIEDLGKLLKILKRQVLLHESFSPVLKCIAYQALYSKEKTGEFLNDAQEKKLNNKMNDLLRAAEKFLMFEKIKHNNDHDTALLYPELINRKQVDLCEMRIKAAEKKLDKVKKKGVEYYNQYFQTQRIKAGLFFINNKLEKIDNYDKLQEYADIKYLLQKLQYHLAKITLERRYAHKVFNLKPFEALKSFLNLPEYQSNLLIKIYSLNIQLVEKEEETTFLALMKLLNEKKEILPKDFLKPFYINLANYSSYKLTKGDLFYHNYLFEIYNNMHRSDLLIKNSNIDIALLKNIITAACRVNDFDWAVDQLKCYIKYVPKEAKNSVFEYNCGVINFYKKKYEEALNHFNKVRKIDDSHELGLRIVQLQSYYETDAIYETATQQLINSLKSYIHQNKKLTKRQKPAYLNFIRVFNKLYKLKDIPGKRSKKVSIEKTLPKLKERMYQFDSIRKKKWLLSKINELENT